jgi:hypothetical protein
MHTLKELKTYVFNSTNEWNSYDFDNNHRNHLASLTSFIQALLINQGPNNIDTFNMMTFSITTSISMTIPEIPQALAILLANIFKSKKNLQ